MIYLSLVSTAMVWPSYDAAKQMLRVLPVRLLLAKPSPNAPSAPQFPTVRGPPPPPHPLPPRDSRAVYGERDAARHEKAIPAPAPGDRAAAAAALAAAAATKPACDERAGFAEIWPQTSGQARRRPGQLARFYSARLPATAAYCNALPVNGAVSGAGPRSAGWSPAQQGRSMYTRATTHRPGLQFVRRIFRKQQSLEGFMVPIWMQTDAPSALESFVQTVLSCLKLAL